MPQPTDPAAGDVVTSIDRLAPARRPPRRMVMHQSWRDLMFLHWAFPAEAIRPLIPPVLELDLFEGLAYVGLVPFTMTGVRPVAFPPVPGLSNFHETNVRTYVHFRGQEPGVWFFSLDAASAIAVRLARGLFHLAYHHARMFLEKELNGGPAESGAIVYAGVRRWPAPIPASYLIRGEPCGPVQPAHPGTLEHFLAERYLLYTTWQNRLYQGQVHHLPYPLQGARVLSLDENLLAAAGIRRPSEQPLAHYAAGVDVEVFSLRCLGKLVP
jgi:uncharacterized protein